MTERVPLLELRNVSRVFGGGGLFSQRQVVALKDFSFTLDADTPTITAIVGESGSGKTTMARLVLGDKQSVGSRSANQINRVIELQISKRKLSGIGRRRLRRTDHARGSPQCALFDDRLTRERLRHHRSRSGPYFRRWKS